MDAHAVGAETVVVHPPFLWQRAYGRKFIEGIERLNHDFAPIQFCVENMYPWRTPVGRLMAYLPHWDPVPQPYDHVTMDLSHTATARSDAMAMVHALGDRLAHVHLADGSGSTTLKDEHLPPGRGNQPCAEFLEHIAQSGYAGAVALEVGTRRQDRTGREAVLAESLAFARDHLAAGLARSTS